MDKKGNGNIQECHMTVSSCHQARQVFVFMKVFKFADHQDDSGLNKHYSTSGHWSFISSLFMIEYYLIMKHAWEEKA